MIPDSAIRNFWRVGLALFACLSFTACQQGSTYSGDKKRQKEMIEKYRPHEKTFTAEPDSVWKAAQKALKYPIAVDNIDQGILETDWIRGEDGFVAAHEKKELSEGMRSKITLRILKGKRNQRTVTRVTVTKKIERQRDFFDDGQSLDSDGWEEKIILYRIERELAIDLALTKGAFKK